MNMIGWEETAQPISHPLMKRRVSQLLQSSHQTDTNRDGSLFTDRDSFSTTLHRALEDFSLLALLKNDATERVQEIQQLVHEYPDCIVQHDEHGLLPIHIACQQGVPLTVIQSLVEARPETVWSRTNDRRRMLPLHLVCRFFDSSNTEKSAVIRYLARTCPETIQAKSADDETPIHLLCRNYFCTAKDVRFLIRNYPAALTMRTRKEGNTPLHIACAKQYMERKQSTKQPLQDTPGSSSIDIISILVRAHPKALQLANKRAELPLHAAVKGSQPPVLISFLLDRYPAAATTPDRHGRTPWHVATLQRMPCQRTIQRLGAAHMGDDRELPRLVPLDELSLQ